MEFVQSADFWIGLVKIVWINIILSGDNAVVIALAARSLPPHQQRKAVFWGSGAAVVLRIASPDMPSPQMAEELSARLGKPVSAALVRKSIQRAHEKFADLLLEEVAGTLEESGAEALEAELRELDLLRYCRSALRRRHNA